MASNNIAHHLRSAASTIRRAVETGVAHLNTEDSEISGRTITIDGKSKINFSSCSYLGIEQHPALKQGTIEATKRYGTQFSSSRAYVSLGLYEELEDLLGRMFNSHVIATPSTTLGHLSALPVLVQPTDVVILDHQVHASVNMATQILKSMGVRVEMIRHNNIDMLENRIKKLQSKYKRIWYLADGIYSMFGDFAPLMGLSSLLNQYECLHLYMDDAHGTSWTGEHGKGYVKTWLNGHPRVVVAASLNKSFGAAGGAIIFSNKEWKQQVRDCGGTLMFGGPIQPPMLGAAIASARLHLSDELMLLQAHLRQNISNFCEFASRHGIPLMKPNSSPIFFIPVGTPDPGYTLVKKMLDKGFLLNLAAYPSVPYHQTGMRLTIHNHLRTEDLLRLTQTLAEELPKVIGKLAEVSPTNPISPIPVLASTV
ncbi:MAG: aminotransferase class I/II-fold pyridoxal phosphate-dependent enzyme [Bacteroidota bacterium]